MVRDIKSPATDTGVVAILLTHNHRPGANGDNKPIRHAQGPGNRPSDIFGHHSIGIGQSSGNTLGGRGVNNACQRQMRMGLCERVAQARLLCSRVNGFQNMPDARLKIGADIGRPTFCDGQNPSLNRTDSCAATGAAAIHCNQNSGLFVRHFYLPLVVSRRSYTENFVKVRPFVEGR